MELIATGDGSAYLRRVELRILEAFVVLAEELHFGRAAARLQLGQPTLSTMVQRLERELGTALFLRTTRHVELTEAGAELLVRATTILADVADAGAAVRRLADGTRGTVRLGVTPPVAPVLAPHLFALLAEHLPDVVVQTQRMWLPDLTAAVARGDVDVGLTCGVVPAPAGVVGVSFCGEPLLVALRPGHPMASRTSVRLEELGGEVVGLAREELFPAWAVAQRQALSQAGITPPSVELDETDLHAARWADQAGVDWVPTISSLSPDHRDDVVLPVRPEVLVPFTLQWAPTSAHGPAVRRFVQLALTATVPPGWSTLPPAGSCAPSW